MSYSVTLKRQGDGVTEGAVEATVSYADVRQGADGVLANAVVLRAAALPDPPPEVIRITFDWVEAAAGPGRLAGRSRTTPADSGAPTSVHTKPRKIARGDRVEVVKSRVSGVKNPPEWLEQYMGRTGIVLWTTADGAMVDFDPDTAWFSYEELNYKD